MELKSVLDGLMSQIRTRPVEDSAISEQAVSDFAKKMAMRGYIPSEQSLLAVEKYLQGYGLWIMGGVGTGKTAFFKCLPVSPSPAILPMITTFGKSVDEIRNWLDDNSGREIVLDDIGAEATFNYYGNKLEILPWILEIRMGSRARTHITTNLNAKSILDRYGARVIDRFAEYFFKVDFIGKSRRKPRPRVKPSISAVSGGAKQ